MEVLCVLTYHCICNKSNMTSATSGAGTSYSFWALDFTPAVFSAVRVAQLLVFYVVFLDQCLAFFFWSLYYLTFLDLQFLITLWCQLLITLWCQLLISLWCQLLITLWCQLLITLWCLQTFLTIIRLHKSMNQGIKWTFNVGLS